MQDSDDTDLHSACSCLATDYPVSYAINALARAHRARAGAMLADIGLFAGQEVLLMKLREKEGEPQKSLCESFGLDHSTVAKSLGRLEAQGLIHREKCTEDGRVTKVFLTDRGRAATAAISDVWSKLESLTVADLTPGERAELVAIARKIVHGIIDPGSTPSSICGS